VVAPFSLKAFELVIAVIQVHVGDALEIIVGVLLKRFLVIEGNLDGNAAVGLFCVSVKRGSSKGRQAYPTRFQLVIFRQQFGLENYARPTTAEVPLRVDW
jgi:hypothetical protein